MTTGIGKTRRHSVRYPVFSLLVLALLSGAVSSPVHAEPGGTASKAQPAFFLGDEAQIVLWGRPIATLRAGVVTNTVHQRAERATDRMLAIPAGKGSYRVEVQPASIGIYEGAFVMVDEQRVLGILHQDLDPDGDQTFDQYSDEIVANLENWLMARENQLRWPLVLRSIGLAAGASFAFFVTLFVLGRMDSHRAARRSLAASDERGKQWMVGDVNIRPYLIALEIGLIRIVVRLLGLFLAYLWLTFVLRQFPYTRVWSGQLSELLVGLFARVGVSVVGAIPNLAMVGMICLITRAIVGVVKAFFGSAEAGTLQSAWLDPETARVTRRLFVVLIWVFALIIAYPYIPGSGTEAFKGVSVFLGLMLSLGSAGVVGQVIGGLVVVYARALQRGDFVRVNDHEGLVTNIGVLSTKIETPRREEITIPNVVMLGATTINFTRLAKEEGAVITTTVTIGYDTPWRQVEALLKLAAERTAEVRAHPPPVVLQKALSDWYAEYVLRVTIERPERRYRILSTLHAQIQDAFNEHGVQIMSPNFREQPDEPVLSPKESWYAAPAAPDGDAG